MKRFSIILIGLALLLPTSAAASVQPTVDSPSVLYNIDIWLNYVDARAFYVYCEEGDILSVNFEVTSGSGISFFVCDEENYEKFRDLEDSTAYLINYNVGSLRDSMTIPHDDTWYIVFVNIAIFYQAHVEGTFTVTSRAAASAMATLVGVIALGGFLIIVIVGNNMRNKGKKPVQYQSGQQYTSQQLRSYSFCPYCGNSDLPVKASFCPSCGKSLGEPPGIS